MGKDRASTRLTYSLFIVALLCTLVLIVHSLYHPEQSAAEVVTNMLGFALLGAASGLAGAVVYVGRKE